MMCPVGETTPAVVLATTIIDVEQSDDQEPRGQSKGY